MNKQKIIILIVGFILIITWSFYILNLNQNINSDNINYQQNDKIETKDNISNNLNNTELTKLLVRAYNMFLIDNMWIPECLTPSNKKLWDYWICENSLNINNIDIDWLYTFDNIIKPYLSWNPLDKNKLFYSIWISFDHEFTSWSWEINNITTSIYWISSLLNTNDYNNNEIENILKENISIINIASLDIEIEQYNNKNNIIPCTIDDINTDNIITTSNDIIYYDYKTIISWEKSLLKEWVICDIITEYWNIPSNIKYNSMNNSEKEAFLKQYFSNEQQWKNNSVIININ